MAAGLGKHFSVTQALRTTWRDVQTRASVIDKAQQANALLLQARQIIGQLLALAVGTYNDRAQPEIPCRYGIFDPVAEPQASADQNAGTGPKPRAQP